MIIERTLRFLWKEFIYGGHFQALGAASIVFVSAFFLDIKISWDILFITYMLLYPVYLYNRYKEIETDYLTNPGRTEYLKTYIKGGAMVLIAAISIFLIGSLIYFSNLKSTVFVLLLLVFGFLYTDIFKRLTRKAPLFKNFYVSSFFALLVIFPIIYYSPPLTKDLVLSALIFATFVFLNAFVMQILLDLKDLESDKKGGLLTVPTIWGRENTFRILKIFSLLAVVPIPIIFSFYFTLFPKIISMLVLTVPFNYFCFQLAKKHNYFGYILMGGMFLLWPVLILLGKILW